jgi:hypothetical protein
MTKLLNEKSVSYDTPIIDYLPAYWSKGPNVNKITFAELLLNPPDDLFHHKALSNATLRLYGHFNRSPVSC